MAAAVHAEWTKLRTVASTGWLLLAALAGTILVGAVAAASVQADRCLPPGCLVDLPKLSLSGVWLGQVPVVVLGVLAITNEYATGMIHTSLAANPWRIRHLLTKAAAVLGAVLGAGLLGVLGSLAAGRLLRPLPLTDGATLRAAAGTVLYLGLIALLSLGIGTIVRDTGAAITAVLTLLYVVPVITAFISDPQWSERLQRAAPMTAGLAIQTTAGLDRQAIGPWAGLGVLALYAAGGMLLGAILFTVRDAGR
jgi:ABC-2 type transport system permease protein